MCCVSRSIHSISIDQSEFIYIPTTFAKGKVVHGCIDRETLPLPNYIQFRQIYYSRSTKKYMSVYSAASGIQLKSFQHTMYILHKTLNFKTFLRVAHSNLPFHSSMHTTRLVPGLKNMPVPVFLLAGELAHLPAEF